MNFDKPFLKSEQYQSEDSYLTRVALMQYAEPRIDTWRWHAEHYDLTSCRHVLEVGCGNGKLWQAAAAALRPETRLTLTDFSVGMVRATARTIAGLGHPGRVDLVVADVDALPFGEGRFDLVLAHLMLYHASSPERAVASLRRMARPDGTVGISTVGPDCYLELYQLANEIDARVPPYAMTRAFSEDRADPVLHEQFATVRKHSHDTRLRIPTVEPILDVIRTYPSIRALGLGEEFVREYAARASAIIERQGAFLTSNRLVHYVCA